MLRKAGKGILIFMSATLFILGISIAPIDYTPLDRFEEINANEQQLKNVRIETAVGSGILEAGWAAVNITPRRAIHMAGYGRRGPYSSVADSLYARTIAFDNGAKKTLVISLDLLMFPRLIKEELLQILREKGYAKEYVFLSATHTHNAFGNWEKSIAGKLIFGGFDEENATFLIRQIVKSVELAEAEKSPVQSGFQLIEASELVENRVAPDIGTKDPYLRVISLKKENGVKGLIVSFAGHAVNLDADIWELSRDYPGVLVDELEQDESVDFAVFCAGMVASHNIRSKLPKGQERIKSAGRQLASKILLTQNSVSYNSNSRLGTMNIDISLPPSQLRIADNVRLRNWLFSAFLGKLEANIKVMGIGDILMIGMPCDFSGELSVNHGLDQYAKAFGKNLFITSFNGNYVGYITEDDHYYTCDHDEVRALNWVGPYKGGYFVSMIKQIIAME